MGELISVIIPVYNAEKYLPTCLESVLNQTYSDLELILVNDGSKDGSGAVCDAFAARDPRVKVIHQKNGGVSAARNSGLEFASGQYVAFIDADDDIKPGYLERLHEKIVGQEADIVCCDYVELLNGQEVHLNLPKVLESRKITDSRELFRDSVGNKEAYGTCVWGKLIRMELAKKCSFRPLKFGEDQVYMFDLFSLSPVVYLDPYKGYYYVRNEDSATMRKGMLSIARTSDELAMHEYKLTNLPEFAKELQPGYRGLYAQGLHLLARAVVVSGDPQERKSRRPKLCEKIDAVLSQPEGVSLRMKLYLRLYRYAPWLYRMLLRIKN